VGGGQDRAALEKCRFVEWRTCRKRHVNHWSVVEVPQLSWREKVVSNIKLLGDSQGNS